MLLNIDIQNDENRISHILHLEALSLARIYPKKRIPTINVASNLQSVP